MLLLVSQASLLAAKSDTEWVTGVVVMALWVVFSIMGALSKKQKEQERQRKLREKLSLGAAPPAADVGRQRAQATEALQQLQQPQRQQQRVAKKQGSKQRRPAQMVSAPPPIPGGPDAAKTAYADIARSEITGAGVARPSIAASADTLHRWLRPETLQQQFILTEILQPPLALREPRQL